MSELKTVFIAAISSDIGRQLAELYLAAGFRVIGTYRNPDHVHSLQGRDTVDLIQCDLMQDAGIAEVAQHFSKKELKWSHFISAVGLLDPIGKYVEVNSQEWKSSIILNSLQQLDLLHALLPFREDAEKGKVTFLVGGAINRAFPNYSAYSLGKVMLVKFCELISDENPDLHCVAIGTGWVASKIHEQTLAAGSKAGDNLASTQSFVDTGEQGTSIVDIFDLINWCFERPETAGRNFSVVHDAWRDGGEDLAQQLRQDDDMFRLRRFGNQHKSS